VIQVGITSSMHMTMSSAGRDLLVVIIGVVTGLMFLFFVSQAHAEPVVFARPYWGKLSSFAPEGAPIAAVPTAFPAISMRLQRAAGEGPFQTDFSQPAPER
jgi:hypothetical protein